MSKLATNTNTKTNLVEDREQQPSFRSVSRIINSIKTTEGGGFIVNRPFPTNALLDFDPFLLLDEMGPKNWKPGEAKGAPDHPHRGFETVTYMLEGRFEHKDSRGNSSKLGPGDIQWMTAGAGVVHSEMPDKEFVQSGGNLHGFQLWVNLPQRDKMIKPRYQDISSSRIPVAQAEDGAVKVKVIAGEALGARAIIETRTPIFYLHFTLQPGAKIVQPIPKEYNTFAYVINGKAIAGPAEKQKTAKTGQMVIFDNNGEEVAISAPSAVDDDSTSATTINKSAVLDILLIGGVPLNEPVARYGPFVMNTKEEILQAIEDYRNGQMGEIAIQ
jgi:redox-sensitive bicupin YhaK (pirin superfamily)